MSAASPREIRAVFIGLMIVLGPSTAMQLP
jgi:hypothetical protein